MEIGIIGLGKMGLGIAKRLISNDHEVFGFDSGWDEEMYAKEELLYCDSIDNMLSKLSDSEPKIIWIMVPSGDPTEITISKLEGSLNKGDIIIDGGNSYYKESIERSERLINKGINFLDSGTSGGIWGEKEGYCLMVGGNENIYKYCEPIFQSLASNNKGAGYMGKSGSGHFVKMIHNGIEYGMMQSMAEGFEILHAKKDFKLDLKKISELWKHGSVVRSWLLDLMNNSLEDDPELSSVAPFVEDSGEGRWTVKESIDLDVPAHAITSSLYSRFYSRNKDSFGFKVLASLRNQFGGHKIKKIK